MLTTTYQAGQRAALEKFGASLSSLEKTAIISSLIRALETPIPHTPQIYMKMRSGVELAANEARRQQWQNQHVNGGIYKALKALKVDKAFQAAEPVIGSTTAPAAERAQYGDRKIHGFASAPLQSLIGATKAPLIGGAYQAARTGLEKSLGASGPVPYGTSFDAPVVPRPDETHASRAFSDALNRAEPAPAPRRAPFVQTSVRDE